jgi:hypothetical protein
MAGGWEGIVLPHFRRQGDGCGTHHQSHVPGGVPKELFQGPALLFPFAASRSSQFGVTADGKRFLFAAPVVSTAQTRVTVVLNWQEGLKK